MTRLKNGMGSCNSFVIAIGWEKTDLLSEGLYLKQGSVEHGTCQLSLILGYAPIVTIFAMSKCPQCPKLVNMRTKKMMAKIEASRCLNKFFPLEPYKTWRTQRRICMLMLRLKRLMVI